MSRGATCLRSVITLDVRALMADPRQNPSASTAQRVEAALASGWVTVGDLKAFKNVLNLHGRTMEGRTVFVLASNRYSYVKTFLKKMNEASAMRQSLYKTFG